MTGRSLSATFIAASSSVQKLPSEPSNRLMCSAMTVIGRAPALRERAQLASPPVGHGLPRAGVRAVGLSQRDQLDRVPEQVLQRLLGDRPDADHHRLAAVERARRPAVRSARSAPGASRRNRPCGRAGPRPRRGWPGPSPIDQLPLGERCRVTGFRVRLDHQLGRERGAAAVEQRAAPGAAPRPAAAGGCWGTPPRRAPR